MNSIIRVLLIIGFGIFSRASSLHASDDACELFPCIELNVDCQSPYSAGYNASAWVDFDCKKHLFSVWISFLYWQPKQDFMDVAFKSPEAIRNVVCGTSWSDGKLVEMNSHYTPGFTVGGVYALPCHDDWDLTFEYTRFHTDNSIDLVAPSDGFLYARWIQPNLISNNNAISIHDKWQLDLDLLSFEIGRRFYLGCQLTAKPYVGLAVVWLDQKFKGRMLLTTPTEFRLHVSDRSDSWGIGPRMGIEGNWYLTKSLSIVGNIAFDIFYTRYHLKLREESPNVPDVFMSSANRFNTLRPELDMYLGLSYEHVRSCSGFHVEIGYDFQIWWNQNMIRWFDDITYISTPQGNLYFQGLRATVGFDF